MKSFPAGVTVTLTLPIIDMNGDPVTPTELSFSVRDLDDVLVVAPTTIDFSSTDTDADVTVQAAFNAARPGATIDGRTVELKIKSAAGTFLHAETYALRPYQRLVAPTNSFVSDAAAQVLAGDMPGLEMLLAADATQRQAALVEAHARITRISLCPVPYETAWNQKVYDRLTWPDVTPAEFRGLNAPFKRALTRAQLVEANRILTGDPIADKRRAGLLSETIGESSMMFRSGKGVESAIGTAGMSELTGYIVRHAAITRA